jgi:AbrB family looped-hinge helix DNA binding protein
LNREAIPERARRALHEQLAEESLGQGAESARKSFNDRAIDRRIMETVSLSAKFQVAIPKSVREQLGLRAGQKMQIVPYLDRIEVIPVRSAKELRGFLKGISTDFDRDPDRL